MLHGYIPPHRFLPVRRTRLRPWRAGVPLRCTTTAASARLRGGQWQALDALWRWRLERTTRPAEVSSLHGELGQLWESQLRDPARAMAHYQAALCADPTQVAWLEGLCRVWSRAGQEAHAVANEGQAEAGTVFAAQQLGFGRRGGGEGRHGDRQRECRDRQHRGRQHLQQLL